MSANDYGKIKVVKLFASSEYKTRNQAYKVVERLLKTREAGEGRNQLSPKDLVSIWKGLYTWLWMQDKPILHEEVVGKICKLVSETASVDITLGFIESFFITLMREWKKIDIHRMDKFYMLTRDFLAASLNWLRTNDFAEQFVNIITSKVLNGVVDQGIEFKLHIIDILLDELIRAESSEKFVTAIIIGCLKSMLKTSQKHTYVLRMKKRVIERIIPLFSNNKLQINLKEVGIILFEWAHKEQMFSKMKKLCLGLSKGFLNYKKRSELIETEGFLLTNIENSTASQNVSAAIEEINETEITNVILEKIEVTHEDITMEIEAVNDVSEMNIEDANQSQNAEEIIVKSDLLTPCKKSKVIKKKISKKTTDIEVESLAVKKRKVSFGKKYTKKFKKGEIDVSLSQGTVKNTRVKSILKKL